MSDKSIFEIIKELRAVCDLIAPFNPYMAFKIDEAIKDLQKLKPTSKRPEKARDLLNKVLKAFHDYFTDS